MKNSLLYILLVCCVVLWTSQEGFAQAMEKAASTETAIDTSEKSLLWEISGKGLDSTSYLYGTIHMIDKKDYFLTDATKTAFDKSSRVVFEINLEDMSDMSAQFGLMMKAFMNDGTTLKDLLTDEEYKLVNDHFSEIGLPLAFLERIKPMFLAALASGDMSPTSMTEGDMMSYELEFMDMATTAKKEMGGLETAEFQMSMFDSIPYQAQAKMLVDAIEANGEGGGGEELEKMIQMYKDQDIEAMHLMIGEDAEGVGKYEELLLVNRNKNWIPIMEEMMKTKVTFFAVGAGHLGGEMGVVNLLREAGYAVKAIF